ncbi:MAG: DUF1059 domain-containing protein [Patescibacteria group bacterium]|nr:DUF1059 domain-containing protein [Patescibacteria group bacterium]
MDKKLMTVECDPMCGFMIRSHDEDEVVDTTKSHLKKIHNQEISDEEAKKQIVYD